MYSRTEKMKKKDSDDRIADVNASRKRRHKRKKEQDRIKLYIIAGLLALAGIAAVLGSLFVMQERQQNRMAGIAETAAAEEQRPESAEIGESGTPREPAAAGDAGAAGEQVSASEEAVEEGPHVVEEQILCAASMDHSAWISGGRLFLAGEPYEGQEAAADWSDLMQVAVSNDHLAALDAGGRVHAFGNNRTQQCNIDEEQFVVSIAAGMNCTVTVLPSGKIQVYGSMDSVQREGLSAEKNARKAVLSEDHAVVLHRDGTVAAYGDNTDGQCEVSKWKNITGIAAGKGFTVGLTSDGKVVYAGADSYGQAAAKKWKKVAYIAAGTDHVVGVKQDGTVLAAGKNTQEECNVSDWKDIVCAAAGYDHTIVVNQNGDAAAAGYNGSGQCDVNGTVNNTDNTAEAAGNSEEQE